MYVGIVFPPWRGILGRKANKVKAQKLRNPNHCPPPVTSIIIAASARIAPVIHQRST
jgi:hypothetical protein